MSQQAYSPAQKYLENRARNLEFFRRSFPGIYNYFSTYKLQNAQVDILTEVDELDLIVEGRHLYSGRATAYAKKEVATFLASVDYGTKIKSIAPLEEDTYKNPRLFAQSLAHVYQHYYRNERTFNGYTLDNFLPLVVFLGVGLGTHIDILNKIRDIHHVVVVEKDMDRFAASLYSVDWAEIIGDRLVSEDRSFSFVLAHNAQDEIELFAPIWNRLLHFCPIFPVTTIYYNHLGDPSFDRVSSQINRDLNVHLFSFGNYDDEINQLNNGLHNFKAGRKLLSKPSRDSNSVERPENTVIRKVPVCVVGSGPSLDERIGDLRKLQPHCIVISCGTAIRALCRHGVKPDFQVELESDHRTYQTQSLTEDKEFLTSIKLLGAAQLNPLMFGLFGESRLFFKDDGPLAGWFSPDGTGVPNATPTCTNAALALTFYLNFDEVYLFGMDFGFPNKDQHHAKGSVYFSETLKNNAMVRDDELVTVPAAAGGQIQTTGFLYTSKRRVENIIAGNPGVSVFNCSNGVMLEHTRWLSKVDISKSDSENSRLKQDCIDLIINSDDVSVSRLTVDRVSAEMDRAVQALCDEIIGLVQAGSNESLADLTQLCFRISNRLHKELTQGNESLYYFLRGSIWHFLLAVYTQGFALTDSKQRTEHIRFWVEQFQDFLSKVPMNVRNVLQNRKDIADDDMVNKSIVYMLPQDLEWHYSGYSIVDDKMVIDTVEFTFEGFCFDGERYVPCE